MLGPGREKGRLGRTSLRPALLDRCEFLKSPPGLGVWFFLVDESLEAKRAAGCESAKIPSFFFILHLGRRRVYPGPLVGRVFCERFRTGR